MTDKNLPAAIDPDMNLLGSSLRKLFFLKTTRLSQIVFVSLFTLSLAECPQKAPVESASSPHESDDQLITTRDGEAGAMSRPTAEVTNSEVQPSAEPFIRIDPEVIRVVTPLNETGDPDFIAVYNDRYSNGVDPSSNVLAGLRMILGEAGLPKENIPIYFKKLGISRPNSENSAFTTIEDGPRLLVVKGDREPTREQIEQLRGTPLDQQLQSAKSRPWTMSECPDVFRWITANQQLVPTLQQACNRMKFSMPLVPAKSLVDVSCDSFAVRQVTTFLSAFAMLKLKEGRVDEAIDAVIALNRLSRHAMEVPIPIMALEGCASSSIADQALLQVISQTDCSVQQLQRLQAVMRTLEAPSLEMGHLVEWERWTYLDMVWRRAKQIQDHPDAKRFDINNALKIGNDYFDRIRENSSPEAVDRLRSELNSMQQEMMQEFQTAIPDPSQLAERPKSEQEGMLLLAKYIKQPERLFVIDLLPTFLDSPAMMESAFRRRLCAYRLLLLGIHLRLFQESNNGFPATLDEIDRSELCLDPYSEKTFILKTTDDGLLLYSVGENRIDEGGQGEFFYGNDFVIRLSKHPR